jgi:hypothetical protein
MSAAITAVAAIGAGAYLQNEGSKRAANAAQNAANAQSEAAQRAYNDTKGLTDRATVAGMLSYDKDIANQERQLARQEQLISQIDPTIIEASQQALRLLKGESTSTLNPLKNQRDMQRQKLVNSLREQLGPGAETSTAGIQALTRFDGESGNMYASAQQQALGNMGAVASSFNSVRPDMTRDIAARSNYGQGGANLMMNQAQILQGANAPLIQSAGANSVGAMMQGQAQQQFGNSLMNMGTTMAGSWLGRKTT